MTVVGYLRERPAPGYQDVRRDEVTATRSVARDLAGGAARVPWCWPVLLTLALGFYQVGRPELWRDELASWSFGTRPLSSLIATTRHTGATQLAYYLLLHFWIAAFGDSADAMRAMSVLAMAAAAACVTLVGRRLAGTRAGLIAGLVFALVPSVSRFAQEIRFYSLEVLVAMLATLLLLRALDAPSARRWLAYAGCLALLGYVDLVALSVVAGHAAGVALRWYRDRDSRHLWFAAAAAAGLVACLPLAVIGSSQAAAQVNWIARPGLDLAAFSFFSQNLFYSTSVAAALIVLAVLAWSVAWREAAFMTAVAVVPVAAVWLVSQGTYSYFYPRYLLLTVGAWAILAGIALSRLDPKIAISGVCVIAILGAGDQQAIRAPGGHDWPSYPVGRDVSYVGYAQAAQVIARQARAGDGIIYQGQQGKRDGWLMIGYGLQYYLGRDMRPGVPVPRELFIAETSAQAAGLYPVPCRQPAACLGAEPRIWVVSIRSAKTPYSAVTSAEAALLRSRYRLSYLERFPGLTVFRLVLDREQVAASGVNA